jgi:hypothetical protein
MKTDTAIDELIKKKFLCPEKFAMDIETYVLENQCDYIEAIVNYCEKNGIDVESVPKLLSKPLKEKIKHNATKLNFLKVTSKTKSVL